MEKEEKIPSSKRVHPSSSTIIPNPQSTTYGNHRFLKTTHVKRNHRDTKKRAATAPVEFCVAPKKQHRQLRKSYVWPIARTLYRTILLSPTDISIEAGSARHCVIRYRSETPLCSSSQRRHRYPAGRVISLFQQYYDTL